MTNPTLKPGQYAGVLVQANTGHVLNESGALAEQGIDNSFIIFDSFSKAQDRGHALVGKIAGTEFVILGESGEYLKVIASPLKSLTEPTTGASVKKKSRN